MNYSTVLVVLLKSFWCMSSKTFNNIEYEYDKCIFVPFWHCKEDYSGLLDEPVNMRFTPYKTNNEFAVCCKHECGVRRKLIDVRITGYPSEEAQFAEFSWMLGLIRNGNYHCGASLIHPKIALTAAHCITATGTYVVRAGELDWRSREEAVPYQEQRVKKIIVHPNYVGRRLLNDIAILEVEDPFYLNFNVGTICLTDDASIYDSSRCVVTGWGRNSYFSSNYHSTLKKLDLSLIPIDTCTTRMQEASAQLLHIHNSFICAGGKNKDTCKGDGGSPLVCPIIGSYDRYVQVGIVSWGLTCGVTNAPGIYVNVCLFKNWIDMEMKRLGLRDVVYRL